MKTFNGVVLYFHDYMTNEDWTQKEVDEFKKEFLRHGVQIDKIETTDDNPFGIRKYDILLFDWGGASMGNSMMNFFCEHILEESLEHPSRIYIMVSTFTAAAMVEAMEDFKSANGGSIPSNVFLNIKSACPLI